MHCTESELVTFGYALLLLNEEYVSIRNDCRPGSAFYRVIHLRKLTSDFGTENPGGAIIIESPYSSSTILDVAANDTIRRERCAYLALPSPAGIKHGWHVGVGLDPSLTALLRYHRPTLWGVCNGAFQECCVEIFLHRRSK